MPEVSFPQSNINTNNTNSMNINNNYNSINTVANTSLQDSQLFLKMLSVSMSNQDPMNPTDTTEFMSQMTQYATIESMASLQASVQSLLNYQLSLNMYTVINNATDLAGKKVDILIPKGTNGSTEDNTVSGYVEKVELSEEGIFLIVNGERYEYDNLKAVYK